jgi:hypothetical protein
VIGCDGICREAREGFDGGENTGLPYDKDVGFGTGVRAQMSCLVWKVLICDEVRVGEMRRRNSRLGRYINREG